MVIEGPPNIKNICFSHVVNLYEKPVVNFCHCFKFSCSPKTDKL